MNKRGVFIVAANRTPLGSFQGRLKHLKAPELGSLAIKGLLDRTQISPARIDEVFFGNVLQGGVGQAPARQAALNAGISNSTPCTTVNKVCASGMKAIQLGYDTIVAGHNDLVLSGGQESMSSVPFAVGREAPQYGGDRMIDLINNDGLTDSFTGMHMGTCAEKIVQKLKITRDQQDEYAIMSYERAKKAWMDGVLTEVSPIEVDGETISCDEEFERLPQDFSQIRAIFDKPDVASITAGNTSKLGDGACAVLVASEKAVLDSGLNPIARIIGHADAATESYNFTEAVNLAIVKALKKYELTSDKINHWEINEAFASVVIAVERAFDIPREKMNPFGGAISLGHPFGCSGSRITARLAMRLKPGELGIAAICNGGGGGGAIVLQGV